MSLQDDLKKHLGIRRAARRRKSRASRKRRKRSKSRRRKKSRKRSKSRGRKKSRKSRKSKRKQEERKMVRRAHDYLAQLIRKHPAMFAYSTATLITIVLAVMALKRYGPERFNLMVESLKKAGETGTGMISSLFGKTKGGLMSMYSKLAGMVGGGGAAKAATAVKAATT